MTINGSSGVYTQFDVISYTGNYENDANYALKTFESHTFKTAIIYNSTFYGTYTVGGDYIFKTMTSKCRTTRKISMALTTSRVVP